METPIKRTEKSRNAPIRCGQDLCLVVMVVRIPSLNILGVPLICVYCCVSLFN
jgi:hypothetical protein